MGWKGQQGRRSSFTDTVGGGSGVLCQDNAAAEPDAFGNEQ